MNLLLPQLVEALGWSLLHFLWQGAAAAVLLALALLLLRKRSAQSRYAAACTVLFIAAGGFCGTVALHWPESAASHHRPLEAPTAFVPPQIQTSASAPLPTIQPPMAETAAPAPLAVQPTPPLPPTLTPETPLTFTQRLRAALPWCVGVWALGVAAFSLRFLAGWRAIRRWKSTAAPVAEASWQKRFASLCALLRVSRPVSLLSSAAVAVPMVVGWLKPVVLVPASLFSGLSAAELEAILAHELAHVRRHDYLVNLLQNLAETLFFYHPAIWWISCRIRQERENCCDDLAAAACGGALGYARALTALEEMRGASPTLAVSASGGSLLQRIRRIVGLPQESSSAWSLGVIAAGLTVLMIALALVSGPSKAQAAPGETAKGKRVAPSSYHDMDSSLLRLRWQPLEGADSPISESLVAGLRSAIKRFIRHHDEWGFELSPDKADALRKLTEWHADHDKHPASEVAVMLAEVLAVHGEPIQMAFNEAPAPGRKADLEEMAKLPFGPAGANGLRAAISLYPARDTFVFGDRTKIQLHFWNTGDKPLTLGAGTGFEDVPSLRPLLNLKAIGQDGREILVKNLIQALPVDPVRFSASWHLRPGETTVISGWSLRLGPGQPRAASLESAYDDVREIANLRSNESVTLTAMVLYPKLPGDSNAYQELDAGAATFTAKSPEDVKVWTAGYGTWPMPGGVSLEVRGQTFHATDVMTDAVLTFPGGKKATIFIASDAFANREPWSVAWDAGRSEFWFAKGSLEAQGPRGTKGKATEIVRVEYSGQSSTPIITSHYTGWPKDGGPTAECRQAIEKQLDVPTKGNLTSKTLRWPHPNSVTMQANWLEVSVFILADGKCRISQHEGGPWAAESLVEPLKAKSAAALETWQKNMGATVPGEPHATIFVPAGISDEAQGKVIEACRAAGLIPAAGVGGGERAKISALTTRPFDYGDIHGLAIAGPDGNEVLFVMKKPFTLTPESTEASGTLTFPVNTSAKTKSIRYSFKGVAPGTISLRNDGYHEETRDLKRGRVLWVNVNRLEFDAGIYQIPVDVGAVATSEQFKAATEKATAWWTAADEKAKWEQTRVIVPTSEYERMTSFKKPRLPMDQIVWGEPNEAGLRLGIGGLKPGSEIPVGHELSVIQFVRNDGKTAVPFSPTGCFNEGIEGELIDEKGGKAPLKSGYPWPIGFDRRELAPGAYTELESQPLQTILAAKDGSATGGLAAYRSGFVVVPGSYTLHLRHRVGLYPGPPANTYLGCPDLAPGLGEWSGILAAAPITFTITDPSISIARPGDAREFEKLYRIQFQKGQLALSFRAPGMTHNHSYDVGKDGNWPALKGNWKIADPSGEFLAAWDDGSRRLWYVDSTGVQKLDVGENWIDSGHWTLEQASGELGGMPQGVRKALKLPDKIAQNPNATAATPNVRGFSLAGIPSTNDRAKLPDIFYPKDTAAAQLVPKADVFHAILPGEPGQPVLYVPHSGGKFYLELKGEIYGPVNSNPSVELSLTKLLRDLIGQKPNAPALALLENMVTNGRGPIRELAFRMLGELKEPETPFDYDALFHAHIAAGIEDEHGPNELSFEARYAASALWLKVHRLRDAWELRRVELPENRYQPGENLDAADIRWSKPGKDGLVVGIRGPTDGSEFIIGKGLPMQVFLRNDGPGPVKLSLPKQHHPSLQVWLENAKGEKTEAQIRYGAPFQDYRHYRLESGQGAKVADAVVESFASKAGIDASRPASRFTYDPCFAVPPSDYSLYVAYRVGPDLTARESKVGERLEWTGTLVGEPVAITAIDGRSIRGLSLKGIPGHPATPGWPHALDIEELYERKPTQSAHHQRADVYDLQLPDEPGEVWMKLRRGTGHYWIEFQDKTYGPIPGDPFERLNLVEYMLKQRFGPSNEMLSNEVQRLVHNGDERCVQAACNMLKEFSPSDSKPIHAAMEAWLETAKPGEARTAVERYMKPEQALSQLNLDGVPVTAEPLKITDLYEPDPENPGKFRQKFAVFEMPLYGQPGNPWLKYPADKHRYYIERDGKTYGPIEGDPVPKLKLDELLRRMLEEEHPNDSLLRLEKMILRGDDTLRETAFALMLGLKEPTWRFDYDRLIETADKFLSDRIPAEEVERWKAALAGVKQKAVATKAKWEAARVELPDSDYSPGESVKAADADMTWTEADKDGMRLGISGLKSGVEWKIGGTAAFSIFLRNEGTKAQKFSWTPRLDEGLRFWLADEKGGRIDGQIVMFTSLLVPNRCKLEPGQQIKLKDVELSIAPVTENRQAEGGRVRISADPGTYKLEIESRIGSFEMGSAETKVTVPAKGEWTGTLTTQPMTISINRQVDANARQAPWTAEKLAALPFGPANDDGLRAAWLLDPAKDAYQVGEILKCRVLFHNSGSKVIEFQGDTWHQYDTWEATDAAGNKIEVQTTWFSGITPQETVRLAPGEVKEVPAHGVGIGIAEFAQAYSRAELGAEIHAKPGDAVTCQWKVQRIPNDTAPLTTGKVAFKVDAAPPQGKRPPVSTEGKLGSWDLAPGVILNLSQIGAAEGYTNYAWITWDKTKGATEYGKADIAMPRNADPKDYSTSTFVFSPGGKALWIVEKDVLRKIDFAEVGKAVETKWKWAEAPKDMNAPEDVRELIGKLAASAMAKFEKALQISLPQTAPDGQLSILVNPDGSVTVDGVSLEEKRLERFLKDRAAQKPKTEVVLRANKDTPTTQVLRILEVCAKAGLSRVSFATQERQPGQPSTGKAEHDPKPLSEETAASKDPAALASRSYLKAYLRMESGLKMMQDKSNAEEAAAEFSAALELFEQVKTTYPEWHPEMVDYRIRRLKEVMPRAGEKASSDKKSSTGSLTSGLQASLAISPKKDHYDYGEVVQRTLTIKNVSDKSISLRLPCACWMITWKGTDQTGTALDSSTMAPKRFEEIFKRLDLAPGESKEVDGGLMVLSRDGKPPGDFEFAQNFAVFPGEPFTLHWEREIPELKNLKPSDDPLKPQAGDWHGTLVSEPLALNIGPAPQGTNLGEKEWKLWINEDGSLNWEQQPMTLDEWKAVLAKIPNIARSRILISPMKATPMAALNKVLEHLAAVPVVRTKLLAAIDPPPKWTATGKVTDKDGQPMEGVEIWVHTGEGTLKSMGPVKTDAKGEYTIDFTRGVLKSGDSDNLQFANVTARKAAFYERNLNRHGAGAMATRETSAEALKSYGVGPDALALPGKPRKVDFVMVQGATIKGRLLGSGKFSKMKPSELAEHLRKHNDEPLPESESAELKDAPLAGWNVWLKGKALPPGASVICVATTDAAGYFVMEDVPQNYEWNFQCETNLPNHQEPVSIPIELKNWQPGKSAEFILKLDAEQERIEIGSDSGKQASAADIPTGIFLAISAKNPDALRFPDPGDHEPNAEQLAVEPKPILTPEDIESAEAVKDDAGAWSVKFSIKEEPAARLNNLLKETVAPGSVLAGAPPLPHVLAIVVNGKCIMAPRVVGEFNREVQISGKFAEKEAREIAKALSTEKSASLRPGTSTLALGEATQVALRFFSSDDPQRRILAQTLGMPESLIPRGGVEVIQSNPIEGGWALHIDGKGLERAEFVKVLVREGKAEVDGESATFFQRWNYQRISEANPGSEFVLQAQTKTSDYYNHEFVDSDRFACFELTYPQGIRKFFGYLNLKTSEGGKAAQALQQAGAAQLAMKIRTGAHSGGDAGQVEIVSLVISDEGGKPNGYLAETNSPGKQLSSGITLSVLDSAGRKPIPAFRVIAGVKSSVSQEFEKTHGDVVVWQPHTLREGKDGGLVWPLEKAYDEMALRVEADGYEPQVFSWIDKKKGAQDVPFELKASQGIPLLVNAPDGPFAEGATVVLGMAQRDAVIEDGNPRGVSERRPEKLADAWRLPRLVTTDKEGRCTLPAETDVTAAVLVVHESGVREMSLRDLLAGKDGAVAVGEFAYQVKLQPWAKISGKVQWGELKGSNVPVHLTIHRDDYGYPGVVAQYEKAMTDAEGNFTFHKVLPGLCQLSIPTKAADGGGAVYLSGQLRHATVKSGENSVIIGGAGRIVRGKLTGRDKWDGVTFHFHPTAPHIGLPGDDAMWKAWGEFQKSPQGPLFFRNDQKVSADGTFAIPNVLPGDYQIFFSEPGTKQHLASSKFDVLPEESGQAATDVVVGEINVQHDETTEPTKP